MEEHNAHHQEPVHSPALLARCRSFFFRNYRKLLLIPFLILVLSFVQIGVQYVTTGDFIHKGVSLKGGVTVTVPVSAQVDAALVQRLLAQEFPKNDVSARSLSRAGSSSAVIVEADIGIEDKEKVDLLVAKIGSALKQDMPKDSYTIEGVGSSLGSSFFRETFITVIVAFVFMSVVVFITFRTAVPSLAVVLAAFSDIVVTVAVVNLLGIRISTAGIASFLMLIGYSVDTDILLSTRVLKRKEGSVEERVVGAMKTGLLMTLTALAAAFLALLISPSDVIREIMSILIIGLLADIVNTWVQNAGILLLYMEREGHESKD